MARSKFRRAPRFENLEARQLLSTVCEPGTHRARSSTCSSCSTRPGPIRPRPPRRSPQNITPDIQATLNYYGVNLQATLQTIASSPAQPPLAWNAQLAQAAQGHSQDMATNQYQSHTGSDGSTPQQRMQAAGYTNATSTGENVYAYASSVDQADGGLPARLGRLG